MGDFNAKIGEEKGGFTVGNDKGTYGILPIAKSYRIHFTLTFYKLYRRRFCSRK